MFRSALAALIILSVWCSEDFSWASREYFTTEQKERLSKINTVLVDTIAITDKGTMPAQNITETVT
jgi:hypothetical protein